MKGALVAGAAIAGVALYANRDALFGAKYSS